MFLSDSKYYVYLSVLDKESERILGSAVSEIQAK